MFTRIEKHLANATEMLAVWVRVTKELRQLNRWLVLAEIFNSILVIAASWGGYLALGWLVDSLFRAEGAGTFTATLQWALAVNLLVQLYREFSPVLTSYISETLGMKLYEKIIDAGETKRSKLDTPTVENPDHREVLTQSGVPADSYLQDAPRLLFSAVSSVVDVIVALVIVLFLHPWICPLMILVSLPLLFNSYGYGRAVQKYYESQWPVFQRVYDLRSIIDDPRRSHELRVDRPRRLALLSLLEVWLEHLRVEKIRLEWRYFLRQIFPILLNVGTIGGLLWWMSHEVVRGNLSVGDLLARWEILAAFTIALTGVCEHAGQLLEHNRLLSKVFELLEIKGQIYSPPKGMILDLAATPAVIEYDGVSVSFPGKAGAVDNVSAVFAAATATALTGPNGSGKSTILGLITRTYDPSAGRVLVAGFDLRTINLRSLWENIAYTPQKPSVFGFLTAAEHVATIRTPESELAYLSGTKVEKFATFVKGDFDEACRLSCIGPIDGDSNLVGFIVSNKPLSAEYPGGINPSGGMVQRLALARTFYRLLRGAKIGIFDEPTSEIDSATRGKLIENICSFKGRATIFAIVHDPKSALNFDRLVVMDSGRIVQDGVPGELMSQEGYFRLSCMQAGLRVA
jgi:ABC-type multidrug transport system fused ATPase/permease subunit